MTSTRLRFNLLASICVVGLTMALSCAGQEDGDPGGDTGSGGSNATGGSNSGSGEGGSNTTATGGHVGTGGAISTGGSTNTGGTSATGGRAGTGGATATGGRVGTGGATATGGRVGTGGVVGTGGATATGGHIGTGGAATGGHVGTGGAPGTGGAATGGHVGTGGSPGTGGATSTTCSGLTLAANGSGEFTHYNFGQGTAKGELGDYQTACGYLGTESGQTDTVMNISNTSPAKNTYFAAIPGDGSFNTSKYCGACVQISNGGKTIVATIIDECPESSNPICQQNPNGELDLSVDAFNALGFSNGNPTGTSWKLVPCPISGNVIVRVKQVNELYIENVIVPIASVSGPGGNASRTSYGSWHFNSSITSGSQLTLTDLSGRTLTVTVSSTSVDQNQDTGKQFPKCN